MQWALLQCQDETDNHSLTSSLPEYFPLLDSPPVRTLRNLLRHEAEYHPDVGQSIIIEGSKMISAEEAEIEFERCSTSALKVLNANYSHLSSAKQIEKSSELVSEVQECINAIGNTTPAHAIFATKNSNLEALLQIRESIGMCSGSALGNEVTKHFQNLDVCLESALLQIEQSMPWEEKTAFTSEKKFFKNLVQLRRLADSYVVFEKLLLFGLCFTDFSLALEGDKAKHS